MRRALLIVATCLFALLPCLAFGQASYPSSLYTHQSVLAPDKINRSQFNRIGQEVQAIQSTLGLPAVNGSVVRSTAGPSPGQVPIFTGSGVALGVSGCQSTVGGLFSCTLIDQSAASLRLPSNTVLPPTCAIGEVAIDTDAVSGQRLYVCETPNTWVKQGDGGTGGGGGGMAPTDIDTSAELRAILTDETGIGVAVFNTNGTLISPAVTSPLISAPTFSGAGQLGAGASIDFRSGLLGLPTGATLPATCAASDVFVLNTAPTGSRLYVCTSANTWTAQGAGVPSSGLDTSAEIAALVTDETGSGSLVFGVSPTLTTPTLSSPTITAALIGGYTSVAGTFNVTGSTFLAPSGTSLPATCTAGQLFAMLIGPATRRLYMCTSTNVWSLQGDGAAVTSIGPCTGPACLADGTANSTNELFVFEGSTVDGNEVRIWIDDSNPAYDASYFIPGPNAVNNGSRLFLMTDYSASPDAGQIVASDGLGQTTYSTCTAQNGEIICPADPTAGGSLELLEGADDGSNTWILRIPATGLSGNATHDLTAAGRIPASAIESTGNTGYACFVAGVLTASASPCGGTTTTTGATTTTTTTTTSTTTTTGGATTTTTTSTTTTTTSAGASLSDWADNMVAVWSLESDGDTTGGTCGATCDLTASGTPTFSTDKIEKVNSAAFASSAYYDAAIVAALQPGAGADWSWGAWVKPTATPTGTDGIFGPGPSGSAGGYALNVADLGGGDLQMSCIGYKQGAAGEVYAGAATPVTGGTNNDGIPEVNKWVNVQCRYNDEYTTGLNQIELVIFDAAAPAATSRSDSADDTEDISAPAANFGIGATTAGVYTGRIDEVYVYAGYLSNASQCRICACQITPTGTGNPGCLCDAGTPANWKACTTDADCGGVSGSCDATAGFCYGRRDDACDNCTMPTTCNAAAPG
jgi:hypothetical protein